MWMNVAQKIECATRRMADDACEIDDVSDEEWDEPEFTMISMGLTAPRDVIAVGTTCLEAIDGLLLSRRAVGETADFSSLSAL